MMNLDEAIQHCEEVSNRERELYKMCPENCNGSPDCRELKHGKDKGCLKCAEEHEQLAEWLKELKGLRLLTERMVQCDFGYDNIPEEYEKYKEDIQDMNYTEGLIYIAKQEADKKGEHE